MQTARDPAQEHARSLHDRIPVILAPGDYDARPDPDTQDLERLRAMLRRTDRSGWETRRVSRKVNSPRNDSPDLLEPAAAP